MNKFIITLLFVCLGYPVMAAQSADNVERDLYQVQSGDVIRINVFNEPDLSIEGKVDPEGVLIVPLLGRAHVGGKTPRVIESYLEARFIEEDFLVRPQISVAVTSYSSRVFYIFGEVNAPGAKPIPPGRQTIDILEAINLGGDLTQFARRREILLRRPDPATGTEQRITIDLDRILRGDQRGGDAKIEVRPQDIIFVPERLF